MLGLGTDILEIKRIKGMLTKYPQKFPQKILAPEELDFFIRSHRKQEYLAGRFAAKEAILKAFGTGLANCSWKDMIILNDDKGKPIVNLKGNLLHLAIQIKAKKLEISISHSQDYAVAFCIIE